MHLEKNKIEKEEKILKRCFKVFVYYISLSFYVKYIWKKG